MHLVVVVVVVQVLVVNVMEIAVRKLCELSLMVMGNEAITAAATTTTAAAAAVDKVDRYQRR